LGNDVWSAQVPGGGQSLAPYTASEIHLGPVTSLRPFPESLSLG
jgi:hypothetical protein